MNEVEEVVEAMVVRAAATAAGSKIPSVVKQCSVVEPGKCFSGQ